MTTPAPGTNNGGNSAGFVLLLLALGVGGYFLFLHSRPAKVEDLVGEWTNASKPWTIRFEEDGDILMKTIGPVVPGSYSLLSDGELKVVMADGKKFQAKATMRNGSLTLTDPDGSSTTFQPVKTPTLTAPGRRPTPAPNPAGPSIVGRWVSTEFANEVLELSPLGEVTVRTRGEPSPYTGQYTYAGGVLRFTLNVNSGKKTVENSVTALSADEMTIFLPRIIGLREERRVTYWRIDRSNYSNTRAKLLGNWQAVGGDPLTVTFNADDTIRITIKGTANVGIFRLNGTTLETNIQTPQGRSVSRMTVESATDTAHVITGTKPNERWEYVRVR